MTGWPTNMDKGKKFLTNWDKNLNQAQHERLDANLERRQFLHNACKATSGLALIPSIALFTACNQKTDSQDVTQNTTRNLLQTEPWTTFAAVQLVLFPADGNGPSATDLNTAAYLNFVLTADDTDPEQRDFILKGIDWLNQLANTELKLNFISASSEQQQQLIQTISTSQSGERWLSYLLLYIFEALLSDPIYGGNPDGIGWQWLQHQAGFPRPRPATTYPVLQKR